MGKAEIKYPNITYEMKKHKHTRKAIAEVLGITTMSLYRKLTGRNDWTIGEVDKLCEYYKKNFYELFK